MTGLHDNQRTFNVVIKYLRVDGRLITRLLSLACFSFLTFNLVADLQQLLCLQFLFDLFVAKLLWRL